MQLQIVLSRAELSYLVNEQFQKFVNEELGAARHIDCDTAQDNII